MRRALILLFVVALMFAALPAAADVFGFGPTLAGQKPLVAEQRGASGPLPSSIVGLEGYSLWGKNAGAAGAATYKWRFGSTPIGDRTLRWRAGIIGGIVTADEHTDALYGGFLEVEAEGLVGLVLVVRFDDGVYVNPGLKVNLISRSF